MPAYRVYEPLDQRGVSRKIPSCFRSVTHEGHFPFRNLSRWSEEEKELPESFIPSLDARQDPREFGRYGFSADEIIELDYGGSSPPPSPPSPPGGGGSRSVLMSLNPSPTLGWVGMQRKVMKNMLEVGMWSLCRSLCTVVDHLRNCQIFGRRLRKRASRDQIPSLEMPIRTPKTPRGPPPLHPPPRDPTLCLERGG